MRAEAPFTDFDALLGRRMAWTVVESQSGYQALRTWLAPRADGKALFAATIGPLVTPRRVVEAVLAGEADAGPLDSYWHALLRRHEPGLAARLRVVAQTPSTPMPLLVVTATIDAPVRERWCAALLDVGARADLRPVLEALQLQGFAAVDEASYQTLAERAALADRLGYTRLA